jgi:hypothetical protein
MAAPPSSSPLHQKHSCRTDGATRLAAILQSFPHVHNRLFHRLSRGAELTSAGKAFLPEALSILQQAERAKHVALLGAKSQVGQLRVGFTSSAIFRPIVPAIVRAFHQHHPELNYRSPRMTQTSSCSSSAKINWTSLSCGRAVETPNKWIFTALKTNPRWRFWPRLIP